MYNTVNHYKTKFAEIHHLVDNIIRWSLTSNDYGEGIHFVNIVRRLD